MTFNKHLWSSNKMDWGTPQDLFDQLNEELGPIPLDVAAWDWNAKCPAWLTIFDDALSLDWGWVCRDVLGVPPLVWCNPPYGRQIGKWVAKMRHEAVKHGVTTVALLPSRTGPKWFHDHIGLKQAGFPNLLTIHPWVREARLLEGRLRFEGAPNSAPFDSMIVVFGPRGDKKGIEDEISSV